MKRTSILIVSTALLLAAAQADAITIGLNPSAQNVDQGNSVDVEVAISDLGVDMAPSISIFDLDLTFEPSLLSYSGAMFGDPVLGDQLDLFGFGSLTDVIDNGSGVVNLYELSFDLAADLDDFQADAFTMVTVTFDALAVGTSALTLTLKELGDSLGDPLTATLEDGSITVRASASAPEPVTVGLLAIGLIGLQLRRRSSSL